MFRLLLVAAVFSLAFCDLNDDAEPRIINGLTAQLRQFPYACSIRRSGTINHVGGGSLISDIWVITARSVTTLFNAPSELAVAMGILNFNTAVVAPGLVSNAQIIVNHPSVNLAVVRIPAVACTAARFGVISSIFLESRIQPQETSALVAGWGPITADKEPNTVLRFSRVNTVISFSTGTTTTISPAGNFNTFECPNTATTLCTWNTTCTTDVGGPLVTPAGLIGVASTTDCGAMDTYLRISAFRDWIAANTGV